MMKVKVAEAGKALHPSETVVAIKTLSGTENLVIEKQAVKDGFISIGYPIRHEAKGYLIELPNESQGGVWRVWVAHDQIKEPEKIVA